jgi:predicted ribosomally synthesized peptide with nif11-like leader
MSKKNVVALLEAGGQDKTVQAKYDAIKSKEDFVAQAVADGFVFTIEELDAILLESGDSFERTGNPAKRDIWWK